jgi:hypothetical protein
MVEEEFCRRHFYKGMTMVPDGLRENLYVDIKSGMVVQVEDCCKALQSCTFNK